MDRPTTRTDADAHGLPADRFGAFLLPSRRPAWDACLGSLEAGPILLTGDSGVGKTWLWRRLEGHAPASWRWVGVDLTPANDPGDLYRLIGHGLGLLGARTLGASRVDLADHLAENHADGRGLALVVEEAQNLSLEVWEEVRVLANRLGRPEGFAALIVVGQTALARRFSTRALSGVEARLAARVHLGPIDADEAMELLARLRPDRRWSTEEVDRLHRDSAGNPWRLIRKVGLPRQLDHPRIAAESPPESRPLPAPAAPMPQPSEPLLGPGRPPIRVEDHLIEVGWSPEDEAEPIDEDDEPAPGAAQRPAGEESVNDPYAALQAWREWTANQARREVAPPTPRQADDAVDDRADDDDSPVFGRPSYRTEGQQGFAPFGPLFTKLAQPRQEPIEPD